MIKIQQETPSLVELQELKVGQTFRYNNMIYLRVSGSGLMRSSVCLDTAVVGSTLAQTTLVEPVDCVLTVTTPPPIK